MAMRLTVTPLLLRYGKWQGALVLSYHRIGDGSRSDLNRNLWTVTQAELDRQLQFLKRWFDVIDPHQLRDDLMAGAGRRVIVTFDDGYRDLYEQAFPVLEANGVRAAMFLCSGFLDRTATAWWDEIAWMIHRSELRAVPPGPWSSQPLRLEDSTLEQTIDLITRSYWKCTAAETEPFLDELASATGSGRRPSHDADEDWITWEMAREMHAAGHRIGAHTVTHPVLSRIPAAQQREEIVASASRIEAELGERPRTLAYPVGVRDAFTAETARAAQGAGIELAFSNYGGRVTQQTFSALDVRRTSAESLRAPDLFSSTLALPAVFARVREA